MYEFLAGPALWAAFIVFAGGMTARIVSLITLSRIKDRVIYNHASAAWGLKSIAFWLIPWGSVSMRRQPVLSTCIPLTPGRLCSIPRTWVTPP